MIVSYRRLKIEDAEKIRIWRNNQLQILRQNKKIKKQNQIIYFNQYILKKNPKLDLFAIDYKNKLIGYGGLVNIEQNFKIAEVSFLLNNNIGHNTKNFQNIFYDFLSFIKKYSFHEKKLRKLYTETYSFRKKQIKLLESFGFHLEGTLKMHIIKNRKIYDSLIHSLFE